MQSIKQVWKLTPEQSHNGSAALVLLVRFLARRAAEADYQALQNHPNNDDTQGE